MEEQTWKLFSFSSSFQQEMGRNHENKNAKNELNTINQKTLREVFRQLIYFCAQ